MSYQLPSHINHDTKDAYGNAYVTLYCKQPKDIRDMIDKCRQDNSFDTRETKEFFKEVIRAAQFEMDMTDRKALERREKMEGRHISQMNKKTEKSELSPESSMKIPMSGENPS